MLKINREHFLDNISNCQFSQSEIIDYQKKDIVPKNIKKLKRKDFINQRMHEYYISNNNNRDDQSFFSEIQNFYNNEAFKYYDLSLEEVISIVSNGYKDKLIEQSKNLSDNKQYKSAILLLSRIKYFQCIENLDIINKYIAQNMQQLRSDKFTFELSIKMPIQVNNMGKLKGDKFQSKTFLLLSTSNFSNDFTIDINQLTKKNFSIEKNKTTKIIHFILNNNEFNFPLEIPELPNKSNRQFNLIFSFKKPGFIDIYVKLYSPLKTVKVLNTNFIQFMNDITEKSLNRIPSDFDDQPYIETVDNGSIFKRPQDCVYYKIKKRFWNTIEIQFQLESKNDAISLPKTILCTGKNKLLSKNDKNIMIIQNIETLELKTEKIVIYKTQKNITNIKNIKLFFENDDFSETINLIKKRC